MKKIIFAILSILLVSFVSAANIQLELEAQQVDSQIEVTIKLKEDSQLYPFTIYGGSVTVLWDNHELLKNAEIVKGNQLYDDPTGGMIPGYGFGMEFPPTKAVVSAENNVLGRFKAPIVGDGKVELTISSDDAKIFKGFFPAPTVFDVDTSSTAQIQVGNADPVEEDVLIMMIVS